MVQTLKKQEFDVISSDDYYKKFYKNSSKLRSEILNCLFRNISFVAKGSQKIKTVGSLGYNLIRERTGIPINLVHKFVSRFLVDLIRIQKFLDKNPEVLNSRDQSRKIHIYLHKLYRLAPVFDYQRARENALRLNKLLNKIYFRPQVMTQIAIIIFITDFLDKNHDQEIIQVNLRTFCFCSAYAFHRTRNKIGLTSEYIRNLKSSLRTCD